MEPSIAMAQVFQAATHGGFQLIGASIVAGRFLLIFRAPSGRKRQVSSEEGNHFVDTKERRNRTLLKEIGLLGVAAALILGPIAMNAFSPAPHMTA